MDTIILIKEGFLQSLCCIIYYSVQVQVILLALEPNNDYTTSDIVKSELIVLKTLDWRVPNNMPIRHINNYLAATGLWSSLNKEEVIAHILKFVYLKVRIFTHKNFDLYNGNHYIKLYQKSVKFCSWNLYLQHDELYADLQIQKLKKKKYTNKHLHSILKADSVFLAASVILCSMILFNVDQEMIKHTLNELRSLTSIDTGDHIHNFAKVIYNKVVNEII